MTDEPFFPDAAGVIDNEAEVENITKYLLERLEEFPEGRYTRVPLANLSLQNAFIETALFDTLSGSMLVFAGFTVEQFNQRVRAGESVIGEKFTRMEHALHAIADSGLPGSNKVTMLGYYPIEGAVNAALVFNLDPSLVTKMGRFNTHVDNLHAMITRFTPESRISERIISLYSGLSGKIGNINNRIKISKVLQPHRMNPDKIGELLLDIEA